MIKAVKKPIDVDKAKATICGYKQRATTVGSSIKGIENEEQSVASCESLSQ